MHAPVQIFLSNPQALRVEFTIDDSELMLWWSPRAGESTDCADRNYSHRDAQLRVFEKITLPGCTLENFSGCDYDPYHSVLHFGERCLHLAMAPDLAAVFLWSDSPLEVQLKSHRHDSAIEETEHSFRLLHREPRYDFQFLAALGKGDGAFQHSHIHAAENPYFSRVRLAGGQVIGIGACLENGCGEDAIRQRCELGPEGIVARIEQDLKPVLAQGRTTSSAYPELEQLRDICVRSLHSMIDESGAMRASLKRIYYLIWVRDAGFCFPFQAAAGWTHKLDALIRLLLDNPTMIDEPGLPRGRMFGQLINRTYSKLEEDGICYVVRLIFTHWTQTGSFGDVGPGDWALIDEALGWVENVTWDEERGLYGEHFADETPAARCRDSGWDYAIGKPLEEAEVLKWDGVAVRRNYDAYFNLLMHDTYVMLAAMRDDDRFRERAHRVRPELQKLISHRNEGIPVYAEQLLETGERVLVPHWGQVTSCCIWGLTFPLFAPVEDWDEVAQATMAALDANPEMHWLNGICSAMAAVDPWFFPEERLLAVHKRVAEETSQPGKYLPMGGAMPEKFNAPEGDLHHDIRPQAFAIGTWLGAWSGLGLRRLPYGLALRPTGAFECIEQYRWRDAILSFSWRCHDSPHPALAIDGQRIPGTLQIPQESIAEMGSHQVDLLDGAPELLWLKSTVQLDRVEDEPDRRVYNFTAYGPSSITFNGQPDETRILDGEGRPISARWLHASEASTVFIEHRGVAQMSMWK